MGAPVFRVAPTISQMHDPKSPHLKALNQRLRQCATRGTRVLSFAEGLPTPLVEVHGRSEPPPLPPHRAFTVARERSHHHLAVPHTVVLDAVFVTPVTQKQEGPAP